VPDRPTLYVCHGDDGYAGPEGSGNSTRLTDFPAGPLHIRERWASFDRPNDPTESATLLKGAEVRYYYAMRYISERSTDPGLLVLASLAEGPKHGYAITRDVEEVAGVKLGPGTLYGALSRLEGRDLIEALPSDDRRRPYRITAAGSAALADQLQVLDRIVDTGKKRLRAAEASA
jgi:DNA-binding PadR family transcriptional regulator